MARKELLVDEASAGERLDLFLTKSMSEEFSRSQIKKLIDDGKVQVAFQQATPHYKVKPGDRITVQSKKQPELTNRAEDIPIDILFEDEEIAVVNKPAGLVVHPAHGNPDHTLVNALLFHVKNLSHPGEPVRPGIVHRLDKDTSGVLVVAKNEKAHEFLAKQFKDHSIERCYIAFVQGVVEHQEGICEEPVGRAFLSRKKMIVRPSGGKKAKTFYRVAKRYAGATKLEIFPHTGRTHQIRVHMAYTGHPVLGDALYGQKSDLISRQALHAMTLGFRHPVTHEKMRFSADLPADMNLLMRQLESETNGK